MRYFIYCLLTVLLSTNFTLGQTQNPTTPERDFRLTAIAEIGFLGVFDHKIQFGQNTTYFDYGRDGGQNTLFPTTRFSLEFNFKKKNTLILLYQPLSINTQVVLTEDTQIDNVLFPAGTNTNLGYDFPFYRLSYLRHFDFKNNRFKLAIGAGVQIRNATTKFESSDGDLLKISRNVGPVPLLSFRTSYQFNKNMVLELDATGIYAPIAFLNGSTSDVLGSFLDASLRQHFILNKQVGAFLNLRYLGGGAQGTAQELTEITDGFTKNWLHFYTVTAGFSYSF